MQLSAAWVFAAAAATSAAGPVRVGRIRIVSQDVFSPQEAARGWFYELANSIHIQTRDSFLRKMLLFREGDTLDVSKLQETERNLRALPFIKSASVTAGAPHDGVADVLVVTQDAWTTQPGGSFGSKGGKTTYSVEFSETDLLGTGRLVSLSYDRQPDRISRSIFFEDPYLLRPFWKGKVLYADNSDGRQRQIELARPFYAFEAPWSADFALERLAQTETIYRDGSTYSTFRQDHRERRYGYGRAIDATASYALRWTAGYDSVDDSFTATADHPAPVLPGRRQYRYLFATLESVGSSYLTLDYVDRDSRFEDFNLAPRLLVSAGYSPRWLAADRNSAYARLEASGGLYFSQDSFALADVLFDSRFDGGPRNAIFSAFFGYTLRRLRAAIPQTFVGRIQVDKGWNLDADTQLAADGLTGLRGYRLHAMTGDRRILLNAEERFFSQKEYLQLVSPGAVLFVDAGTAVPEGEKLSLGQMRMDAGVGLRFAIARAGGSNILRIDAAYAFRGDPLGRKGWLVSFSSSQAFDLSRTSATGQ